MRALYRKADCNVRRLHATVTLSCLPSPSWSPERGQVHAVQRVLGRRQAIVKDFPGVTRDALRRVRVPGQAFPVGGHRRAGPFTDEQMFSLIASSPSRDRGRGRAHLLNGRARRPDSDGPGDRRLCGGEQAGVRPQIKQDRHPQIRPAHQRVSMTWDWALYPALRRARRRRCGIVGRSVSSAPGRHRGRANTDTPRSPSWGVPTSASPPSSTRCWGAPPSGHEEPGTTATPSTTLVITRKQTTSSIDNGRSAGAAGSSRGER